MGTKFAGVAESVYALGLNPGLCRFDPCRPHQHRRRTAMSIMPTRVAPATGVIKCEVELSGAIKPAGICGAD